MNIKNKEEMDETTQPDEMTVASQAETESFDDLPVEDEEQVKGGPGGYGSGGVLINHNETTAEDDEDETESLDDLSAPVNALPDLEPEGEVVGGALKGKPMHLVNCGDGASGGSTLNHNETTVEDEATEESELNDLAVDCEAEAEVKGGGEFKFKEFTITKKTD